MGRTPLLIIPRPAAEPTQIDCAKELYVRDAITLERFEELVAASLGGEDIGADLPPRDPGNRSTR